MSTKTDSGETVLTLRERFDGVTTRLVLDGATNALAGDLARLGEQARGNGCLEAALMAAELSERVRKAGKEDLVELEASLPLDLARMSLAIDAAAGPAPVNGNAPPREAPPPAVSSLAQDPELVGDFLLESREHLTAIESKMLALERNPADAEALNSVFRGFHTIKGLAGFLEFNAILEVAHEVETLLDLARGGQLAITPALVDVVLESADCLKRALNAVEAGMSDSTLPPVASFDDLLPRIRRCATQNAVEPAPPEATLDAQTAEVELSAPQASQEGPRPEAPVASPAVPSEVGGKTSPVQTAGTQSVRVDTAKLDHLMDMVGEMVIAQSLVSQNPHLAEVQDSRLLSDLSQLGRITGDVQRTAMAMRMLPIGHLFQRTARQVRDLSRKCGKQVELETSGEDTQLDKNIAEELSDPLMHMVRNAIDHGIEQPGIREAAGKSPTARVRLAAYHQGGHIVIEISDDGRGLDEEKILKKARQNGLIGDAAHLSQNEILNLIFEPGFSTADHVTDVSGRGVGMDVVRKHVQKLRGRIDIQSKSGQGTTFFLKLPLTLAIIEGLVVVVGSQRYIAPMFAVREMFRPKPELLSTIQGRDEMAMVRGRLLPIVRLHKRFDVTPQSEDPGQGILIVTECQEKLFCLLVDDVIGKQEVVIKSLGEGLKNIAGVAGSAILGDGRVGLILEMEGLFGGLRP
jgi:two-component system, chemotaxis family, sensor kinase CheA